MIDRRDARDYFLAPAQTNLEFYAQVIGHGVDSAQQRGLAEAYQFALRQVFPLARGSGKPFIAHLVGTASLVLESGCPDHWVTAALIHAVYQHRVPFAGELAPGHRRAVVAELFGPDVDDLVDRYTEFEDHDLSRIPAGFLAANADVVTLRLADELEDICGNALALHGSLGTGDDTSVRGSYASRRQAKERQAQTLLNLSTVLGLSGIARGFSHWLDFPALPDSMRDFRTGWLSSVDLREQHD